VTSEVAISIDGISKRFGGILRLDRLTLSIRKGVVFGLLGPNGAGKTTTMRTLLGLVRPDAGTIAVLGLNPRTHAREIRSQVGVLLEGDGLYSRLTGWHNLRFHARVHHLPDKIWHKRAEESLRSMDLWERRDERVGSWSKGMRVKLALTRALMHQPKLLLLDEPFSGLDPVAAVNFRERIVTLAKDSGVTVVLATHDLGHVERSCDDVAVIQDGRVVASGTPDELEKDNSQAEIEMEVKGRGLNEGVLSEMMAERIILSFLMDGASALISCTYEGRDLVGAELIRRGVVIEELHTIAGSLEASFMSIVSKRGASA
jgi:ABC-2 type transport system ATP-binding protein